MDITGNKKSNLSYHRVVVKLGTNLLTGGTDHLDEDIMSHLVTQVARLHQQELEILVVSSGAIALGKHKLGLVKQLRGIPFKQVLASVGQSRLMYVYEQLFGRHNITVAQALLTKADLSDRAGYLNTRNTLLALLELGVICIVNENDVVAVDEIQEAKFGDNDNLSASEIVKRLTESMSISVDFSDIASSKRITILDTGAIAGRANINLSPTLPCSSKNWTTLFARLRSATVLNTLAACLAN